ncbi:MAG: membrane-bound lytic murein transglycosylase F [Gammaproteobacteria bacterium]|jgi:membrane-bound lytic murein transglycosylase F
MTLRHPIIGPSVCLLALVLLAGIGLSQYPSAVPQTPHRTPAPLSPPTEMATLPVADLSEIRFRRKFRILVPAAAIASERAARSGNAAERRTKLIEQFAEEQFLLPERVVVPDWQDLVPALLAGHGDLIGGHMQIRELRERDIPFTVPITDVREVLITRIGDAPEKTADLNGREIAIRARSSFWPELLRLQEQTPKLTVRILDDSLDTDAVLQGIANLDFDMAIINHGARELGVAPWESLQNAPQFSSSTHLAFGLHPSNDEMKRVLNDFLIREQLVHHNFPVRTDDLADISRQGVLRVLIRNDDASYFIWRGRPHGFEYELMRRFAERHKLSLEMILAQSHDDLLAQLLKGTGDVVATSLVPNAKALDMGVTFTRPYREIKPFVITHADDTSIQSTAQLNGRTLTLRRPSPVWSRVQTLIKQGLDIKVNALPESVRSADILTGVASGLYDSTIVDRSAINAVPGSRDDIRTAFALDEPVSVSWAVRKNNPQLLKALNEFLDKEYKQVFYNVVHARYFKNSRLQRARNNARAQNSPNASKFSPYDDIVRAQAKKYGFDWLLIVAVMFKESGFNPDVVSWAGAKGLMQVLPVTAKRFGVQDLNDPVTSITAGVRVLSWLHGKLEGDLSVQDRTWFALAAYNAGLGHLYDARRLSRELKLDPNRWFGNVETAMRLLEKPEYYRKSRHGYVRGNEPVTYVREIRALYNAYKGLQDS